MSSGAFARQPLEVISVKSNSSTELERPKATTRGKTHTEALQQDRQAAIPVETVSIGGVAQPPLLNTARLCAVVGVNASTIWRWVRDRQFPKPMKPSPNVCLWRTVEVDAWLNSSTKGADQ